MEFQKDTVTYSKSVFEESVLTDAGGDVIIPDTAPDVNALLWVGAHVCLDEKSQKDGVLTLAGHADFTALYRPEDAPDSLASASYTFPFSHSQEIRELDSESFVTVQVLPATVTGVMQNSRKLKVNAKIALLIQCENQVAAEALTALPENSGVECQIESVSLARPAVIMSGEVCAKGETELPAGNPELGKVQDISVLIINEECQSLYNKLIWKSTLSLSVLYTDPEGNVFTAESEFPVTEILNAPGLTEEMLCRITSSVDGVSYRMTDERHLEIAVTLTVSMTAYESGSFPCITDAYCPGKALSTEEESVLFKAPPLIKQESVTRKETVTLDESEPPIARVLAERAVPTVEDMRILPGSAEIDVRLALTLFYLSAEETPRLCTACREIRFTEPVTDPRITENMEGCAFASLHHISFCLLSAEEAEFRLSLSFRLFLSSRTQVSFLTGAQEAELPMQNRPSVVISFAREGDTLWNIAKRYNVPMEDLLTANDITADLAVTDGMQFLIPR